MHASIDRTDVGHAAAIDGGEVAARPPPPRSMAEVGCGVSWARGRRACLSAAESIDHRLRASRDLVAAASGPLACRDIGTDRDFNQTLRGNWHRSGLVDDT